MPDCFISYAKKDEPFARFIYDIFNSRSLSVFLASISQPGSHRLNEILKHTNQRDWVIFLASKENCSSPCILLEVAQALNKNFIPVVWDIDPSELPVWINRFQAIDLRNKSVAEINDIFSQFAK